MSDNINIEVVYALPHEQLLLEQQLPSGTTVVEAVRSSGLLQKHPEIDLNINKLGIFGKLAKPDTVLRNKDRIEIYRPLIADPKEVRLRRGGAKPSGAGAGASHLLPQTAGYASNVSEVRRQRAAEGMATKKGGDAAMVS